MPRKEPGKCKWIEIIPLEPEQCLYLRREAPSIILFDPSSIRVANISVLLEKTGI
jgi:hypothetical protein